MNVFVVSGSPDVRTPRVMYAWGRWRYGTYTWIRGYHLGGRSITWGRQTYRLSDYDFNANRQDGNGIDWPIRYADISPWYDRVERFAGISGANEGLEQLPDGQFLPPMDLNCV